MKVVTTVALALAGMAMAACAPVAATPNPAPTSGPATITLERTRCFGFCPDYTVSINQDGLVRYEGRNFVNVRGVQTRQIPVADVNALLARFDAVNFNSLRNEYRAGITDIPSYTLTLERNGVRKSVLDYGGTRVGLPESVRALEDEIDRVAGTEEWVRRNGQPVRDQPEPQQRPK